MSICIPFVSFFLSLPLSYFLFPLGFLSLSFSFPLFISRSLSFLLFGNGFDRPPNARVLRTDIRTIKELLIVRIWSRWVAGVRRQNQPYRYFTPVSSSTIASDFSADNRRRKSDQFFDRLSSLFRRSTRSSRASFSLFLFVNFYRESSTLTRLLKGVLGMGTSSVSKRSRSLP